MMRIVIERGHGPFDPGAIGPTGLTEYEVVRAVCQRLGGMGYEVKGRHRRLSLVLLALRLKKPDAVVSIHCNAGSKTLHECRVYHWQHERDIERFQRSQELAALIADKARGYFAEAASVQWFPIRRKTRRGTKLYTPGILKGTAKQAAVVVETGFISDPHTEAAMRTESWRDRVASALDEAIRQWKGTG